MTSKIRHSQLDTKNIKEIKVIYNKYDSRATEINQAIWTIKKFGIPISDVTLEVMKDKAWFYRKQAWETNVYLDKKLGRTVSEKRKILIEKCKTKCGATVKGSREAQSLRPAQQGTSLFKEASVVQVRPSHNLLLKLRSESIQRGSDGSSPSAPQIGENQSNGGLRGGSNPSSPTIQY
ncbi:MAG: hypothetical protein Q8O88_04215 [bacterium]|nr:hypothetical protein [bacterium]